MPSDGRKHEIITLRFFEGKTQIEAADKIGISQASSLEKRIEDYEELSL